MYCRNPTEEVLKSKLKYEPVLFVGVFLQPIRRIHGHNFEFVDDISVFMLSFNPSVTDQSVLLGLALSNATYSELLFGIKLSPFKYGRLFLLHS